MKCWTQTQLHRRALGMVRVIASSIAFLLVTLALGMAQDASRSPATDWDLATFERGSQLDMLPLLERLVADADRGTAPPKSYIDHLLRICEDPTISPSLRAFAASSLRFEWHFYDRTIPILAEILGEIGEIPRARNAALSALYVIAQSAIHENASKLLPELRVALEVIDFGTNAAALRAEDQMRLAERFLSEVEAGSWTAIARTYIEARSAVASTIAVVALWAGTFGLILLLLLLAPIVIFWLDRMFGAIAVPLPSMLGGGKISLGDLFFLRVLAQTDRVLVAWLRGRWPTLERNFVAKRAVAPQLADIPVPLIVDGARTVGRNSLAAGNGGRIAVIGQVGSGRSHLACLLALDAIQGKRAVPVLLQSDADGSDIFNDVHPELENLCGEEVARGMVKALLARGRILMVFDIHGEPSNETLRRVGRKTADLPVRTPVILTVRSEGQLIGTSWTCAETLPVPRELWQTFLRLRTKSDAEAETAMALMDDVVGAHGEVPVLLLTMAAADPNVEPIGLLSTYLEKLAEEDCVTPETLLPDLRAIASAAFRCDPERGTVPIGVARASLGTNRVSEKLTALIRLGILQVEEPLGDSLRFEILRFATVLAAMEEAIALGNDRATWASRQLVQTSTESSGERLAHAALLERLSPFRRQ